MSDDQRDDRTVSDGPVVVVPEETAQLRHEARADQAVATEWLAVGTVRRQCNQHDCRATTPGDCDHPDHERDVEYLRHCLTMLGLPGASPQSA